MLSLREYRQSADRLADHLPWAALVAPGVVLNKDGSFQRTLRFRGPDLESATEAELVAACARANNVLKRFGLGWALHFEAERREALGPGRLAERTARREVARERLGGERRERGGLLVVGGRRRHASAGEHEIAELDATVRAQRVVRGEFRLAIAGRGGRDDPLAMRGPPRG